VAVGTVRPRPRPRAQRAPAAGAASRALCLRAAARGRPRRRGAPRTRRPSTWRTRYAAGTRRPRYAARVPRLLGRHLPAEQLPLPRATLAAAVRVGGGAGGRRGAPRARSAPAPGRRLLPLVLPPFPLSLLLPTGAAPAPKDWTLRGPLAAGPVDYVFFYFTWLLLQYGISRNRRNVYKMIWGRGARNLHFAERLWAECF